MLVLQIITYSAIIVFIAGMARTVIKYATAPIHLRWELYPVPHDNRQSDGSYFEEIDWWTKPLKYSLFNTVTYMFFEIVFIRGLYENNRKLWNVSFPFHFGLYLLLGWAGLVLLGGIIQAFGIPVTAGNGIILPLLYYVTVLAGFFGLVLSIMGCFGLLMKRLRDEDLKTYTAPSDYFNLIFIGTILVTALFSWLLFDLNFSIARGVIASVVTVSSFPEGVNVLIGLEILLIAAFMIYFPFTHMTHMVTKYFMYHHVRMQDEPNRKGSKVEAKVRKCLEYQSDWTAPHCTPGKTWKELVTEHLYKGETHE